jgi:hypothetical protein
VSSNECGSLEDGLEESNGHDSTGTLSAGRCHCQSGPCYLLLALSMCLSLKNCRWTYHACWKEIPRLDVVQRDIARYLANGIAHSKDRIDLIKLIPLETEIFSHSRQIGIVEIRPIQIVQEVHKTAKSKDKGIELEQ